MGRGLFLISFLAIALLATTAVPSSAAAATRKAPKSYVPKKGKPCKKGYRSVVRRRHKRICVRRQRKPIVSVGAVKIQVALDPVNRDPLNPFKVSFSFHAAATRVFTSPAREVPDSLPVGVLSLFSDGRLECAVNLGGANAAGSCPVTYAALGDHSVTLVYTSGEASVSTARTESIGPIPTSIALAASFRPAAPAAVEAGLSGYLDVSGDVSPAGTANVGCMGSDPSACIDFIPHNYGGCCGHTGYTFSLDGTRTFPVRVVDQRLGVCFDQPSWEVTVGDVGGDRLGLGLDSGSVGGQLFARSSVGPGYLPSSATAAVQFTPPLPPDPCTGRYGQLSFSYEDLSDEPPPVEAGATRVGTVQVLRDPEPMTVYCTSGDAIGGDADCIPPEIDELAVYVSSPTLNDCTNLHFESETDPGVYFTRSRAEVEAGTAKFYGVAQVDDKWATGAMDFQPLVPTACP